MMIDPPINELLAKVDCRYTLAVETSKRARQIIAGGQPMVDSKEIKPLAISIDEVHRGLLTYSRDETEV